jgi:hypothetical protein
MKFIFGVLLLLTLAGFVAEAKTELTVDTSIDEAMADIQSLREEHVMADLSFNPARPRSVVRAVSEQEHERLKASATTNRQPSIWVIDSRPGTAGDRLIENYDAILEKNSSRF